jgi:ADP-heptose:LPS heptosyltransferase
VRRLRGARYDVVVDSMVFSPSFTTLLLMLASGAPHRVGVAREGKPNVYTLLADPAPHDAHHVEHAAQLARPFGVDVDATRFEPEIVLGADERAAAESTWGAGAPRLLVNVSAGLAFRRWPDERFAAVIAHLRARVPGARVLVIGSPDEAERADAIAAAGGAARVVTSSIRDAFALVATSDFLFTPDTSIGHAASAFRTPAVVLFVRGISARWGLYGTRGRSLESEGETLASLPLEPVLAAVDAVLEEIALVPAPATDQGSHAIAPR